MPQYFTEIYKKLFDELKKASVNPHPLTFVRSFLRLFFVCIIIFFAISLVFTVFFIFVLSPYFNTSLTKGRLGIKNERKQCISVSKNEFYKLKRDVAELKNAYIKMADATFWQNNKQEYTYDFPNYTIKLASLETSVRKNETSKKYIYGVNLCSKNASIGCFEIFGQYGADTLVKSLSESNDKRGYKRPTTINFSADEIIVDLTAEAYSISGVDSYIFTGNVTTNKGVYPFVFYPNSSESYINMLEGGTLLKNHSPLTFDSELANGLRLKSEANTNATGDYIIEITLNESGQLFAKEIK